MLDMITLVLFILAFVSLVVAAIAIGWLSIVSKHLSALGKRVLESEDIGKVVQAADKTASFESRLSGCEKSTDEGKNQLVEHEAKLNELTDKQTSVQQIINRHAADLANTSEKMASFELRFNEFENNIGDKLNKLLEYETKVNELVSKLESVEQMVNRNESGLVETDGNIKSIRDEIDNLKKFQTSLEKTRSLILAAFTDMQETTPSEESLGITYETAKPEETSQEPEGGYQEAEDQKAPGTYNLEL
jgi:chromosome segregation ATPase